jgi:phage terminase small subunit
MLTPKQEAFVQHYATTRNATQSAILAGYSKNGASTSGSNLLRHEGVRGALMRIEARKLQEMGDAAVSSAFTRKQVLEGLYKEATRNGKGATHAARVTAWRQIAELEGYLGRGAGKVDTAMLTALKIEIVKPDGEIVKVSAGQAVKQLKE